MCYTFKWSNICGIGAPEGDKAPGSIINVGVETTENDKCRDNGGNICGRNKQGEGKSEFDDMYFEGAMAFVRG